MRASRRFSAIASSLVCSLALGACRAKVERVTIGRVVIDAPRELEGPGAAREAVRAGISERLGKDPITTLDADERDATHVLHVRIGAAYEAPHDAGPPERPVQVRLRPVGTGPLYEVMSRARGPDTAGAILAAFDEAWGVIGQQRHLELAADPELVAALADPDLRLRDFAVTRLGDRKSALAVEPLCKLLEKEEHQELVLRAIGGLVSIGDARAVEPLIELSNRKDPDFVLQIVFAVGSIGGRTAEAYLVTMASGHPIEAIRRGAEQALGELKQRKR